MPKDVVSKLPPIEKEEAYPARFDMTRYEDPYPDDVMNVAYPVAEAFAVACQRWGEEEAGTFTPTKLGGHMCTYPKVEKYIPK